MGPTYGPFLYSAYMGEANLGGAQMEGVPLNEAHLELRSARYIGEKVPPLIVLVAAAVLERRYHHGGPRVCSRRTGAAKSAPDSMFLLRARGSASRSSELLVPLVRSLRQPFVNDVV